MTNIQNSFPEKNQNFWHLTSIQGMSFALPGLILPAILAKQYGNGTALCSLLLGNLITWFISVAIVSMSYKGKNHATKNVKNYFGKQACFLVSFILLSTLLIWYAVQIRSFNLIFESMDTNFTKNKSLLVGLLSGIIVAILSIGGIRFIRKTATFVFPILLIFVMFIIIKYFPSLQLSGSFGISYAAVALSIAIELPGTVNLPTFFRHSSSNAQSMLALILINFYLAIYGLAGICIGSIDISELIHFFANSTFSIIIISIVSTLSLLGTNLVNIYFASAGWETLVPFIKQGKEYFLLGILGTSIFALFYDASLSESNSPLIILEDLSNGFLSCLAITLLIAYAVVLIVRHRPRLYEKVINSIIWALGCIGFGLMQLKGNLDWSQSLTFGIGIILISYILILFIEETSWATATLLKQK